MGNYKINGLIKRGPFESSRDEGFDLALTHAVRDLIREKRGAIPGVGHVLQRLKSPHLDQNDPLLEMHYWYALGSAMGEKINRFPGPPSDAHPWLRQAFWNSRRFVLWNDMRRKVGRLPTEGEFVNALGAGERFGRKLYREAWIDQWIKDGVRANGGLCG